MARSRPQAETYRMSRAKKVRVSSCTTQCLVSNRILKHCTFRIPINSFETLPKFGSPRSVSRRCDTSYSFANRHFQIEAPFTTTTNINYHVYSPQIPLPSSQAESSESSAVEAPRKVPSLALTRESSGENSSFTKDIRRLEILAENERLKDEVESLKRSLRCEDRLRKELARLKNELDAEKIGHHELQAEFQKLKVDFEEQQIELETQTTRAHLYECQDLRVNEFQVGLRQSYVEEIKRKNDKIKQLEAHCNDLMEENQKYHEMADKFQEESKETRDRLRCSQIKQELEDAEDNVRDLTKKESDAREQLSLATKQGERLRVTHGDRSSKSRMMKKNNDDLVDNLEETWRQAKQALRNAEDVTDALNNELEALTNTSDLRGDPDHQRDTYPPTPGLSEDRSSSFSGSPPFRETADTTLLERHFQNPPYVLFGQPIGKPVGEMIPNKNISASRRPAIRKEQKIPHR